MTQRSYYNERIEYVLRQKSFEHYDDKPDIEQPGHCGERV